MRSYTAYLLYGASALLSLPAFSQTPTEPSHADARVPETKYDSAFRNYVPYREQPLAPWRDVNDEVGRVGGHIGMFGGGHGGHAGGKPSPQPQAGAPAANPKEATGQLPAHGAPAGSGKAH